MNAVAVLPDGRVVSGGDDGRVLVWDPSQPGADPVELGRHDGWVEAVAVLPDGRVVSGGARRAGAGVGSGPAREPTRSSSAATTARWRRWRCCRTVGWSAAATTGGCWCGIRRGPGADPVELGRHDGSVEAVAVLPDGRVVSGGDDGRVLVWDPAEPGAGPVELGRHDGSVEAVAVLPDGRVVSGGDDGRVLVWDPAAPGS